MKHLFVSVIIPTYHDWEHLKLCINALRGQTYPAKYFEVIIINNAPEDTIPQLDLPDNFRIISESKPGSYAARNKGIYSAKGEILAFTDSDCIPCPDWIEQAVKLLVGGAQRVAGRMELFYKSDKLTPAEIYEKAFAFDQLKSTKLGGALTANMITWKDNFAKVGLFNDSLMSGGDNAWGWRAQEKGINVVYAPFVVVRHPARNTMRELLIKEKRIVGGFIDIERILPRSELWKRFLHNLLPPIKPFFRLIPKKDLSLLEKIVAGSVLMYLYLYRIYQRIRIAINQIGYIKQK